MRRLEGKCGHIKSLRSRYHGRSADSLWRKDRQAGHKSYNIQEVLPGYVIRARNLWDGSSIVRDWKGWCRWLLPHSMGTGRERKGSGCRVTRARSGGLDVVGAGSGIAEICMKTLG